MSSFKCLQYYSIMTWILFKLLQRLVMPLCLDFFLITINLSFLILFLLDFDDTETSIIYNISRIK